MKLRSIQFKAIILYALLYCVIGFFLWRGNLYLNSSNIFYKSLDQSLKAKADTLSATISSYVQILGGDSGTLVFAVRRAMLLGPRHSAEAKIAEVESKWLQSPNKFSLNDDYVNFYNANEKLIVSSRPLPPNLRPLLSRGIKKALDGPFYESATIESDNINVRIINVPFAHVPGGQYYILQVVSPRRPVLHILQHQLKYLAIGIIVILVGAGIVGRFFIALVLKPVVQIAVTASSISQENLKARVATDKMDAEMKYLADAFNDMITRLEESFTYISEFSSHVAHELKTPLSIIKGEAGLTLRKERDIEEYKRVIQLTIEEVDRINKIIDDLLLMAKIEYRTDRKVFQEIDLTNFLNDIYEQMRLFAKEKNIDMTYDVLAQEILVLGDAVHLRRVFFNLIDNALKFSPENGRVLIGVHLEKSTVAVSITDSGVGIKKEDLDKIFNRFYRGKNPSRSSGYGLGLYIAQSIVQAHHGSITVASEPDKGSIFTVTLPLA
ncbi:MAG: HAMP domain-containing protein [Candidatus Omnitrophica bacterium]|nr:HAMP domain-containing protein [Candidatus Omnitrophota bacterium]